MPRITDIKNKIRKFPKKDREIFDRIYHVEEHIGRMNVPKAMASWVNEKFGSVKAVESQKIINVTNLRIYQGALFNELRSKRPRQVSDNLDVEKIIKSTENDPFCNPEKATPSDIAGRIRGRYGITGANIAKYDAHHGLVIFKEHHPHHFTEAELSDYISLAQKWCDTIHKKDRQANYPFIMWNCLWKSGASIVHGHMQMLMGKGCHYANIEMLKKAAENYGKEFGRSYFDDIFMMHQKLGLGMRKGRAMIYVNITPTKEKETVIVAPELDAQAKKILYRITRCFIDRMGVQSFNVGIQLPPIEKAGYWKKMPVVISILDRGELSNNTTDMGGMEIYGGDNIIGTDPYYVFENIKKALKK